MKTIHVRHPPLAQVTNDLWQTLQRTVFPIVNQPEYDSVRAQILKIINTDLGHHIYHIDRKAGWAALAIDDCNAIISLTRSAIWTSVHLDNINESYSKLLDNLADALAAEDGHETVYGHETREVSGNSLNKRKLQRIFPRH